MGTAVIPLLDRLLDPPPPALGAVEAWLARRRRQRSRTTSGPTWTAFADPDGAVGLVPSGPGSEACRPALLVLDQVDGYGVTVRDAAADPEELGPYATIEDALRGIGRWMALAATTGGGGLGTGRAIAA